jgi:hypothetical protein
VRVRVCFGTVSLVPFSRHLLRAEQDALRAQSRPNEAWAREIKRQKVYFFHGTGCPHAHLACSRSRDPAVFGRECVNGNRWDCRAHEACHVAGAAPHRDRWQIDSRLMT